MEQVNTGSVLQGVLTKSQLAQQLGVSERTIDRWHSLRIGPPRATIGRLIFYSREGVSEWLRRAANGATKRTYRR
jgi:predicted DNA-binding transcriptional regulator AlpA